MAATRPIIQSRIVEMCPLCHPRSKYAVFLDRHTKELVLTCEKCEMPRVRAPLKELYGK